MDQPRSRLIDQSVRLLPLIVGPGVAGAGIALAMQGVLSNSPPASPSP